MGVICAREHQANHSDDSPSTNSCEASPREMRRSQVNQRHRGMAKPRWQVGPDNMKHSRPEHMPQGNPCTRCGLPFLWHRVRNPTPEYLAQKHQARILWLEERRKRRLEEAELAKSRLGAMVKEYESRPAHVSEAFKRKLFEAWWQTRKASVRHELATERLVRHLGRGPLLWRDKVYLAKSHETIELEEER